MKTNRNNTLKLLLFSFCTSLLVQVGVLKSHAADGSWNSDVDDNWSTPGSWLGSVIASGAGSTAYFTNDITAARTVTLDSARTNGNLTFADADPITTPGGWILSGSPLTLTNSAAVPVITVNPINNGDATNDVRINSVIYSGQGFVKKGAGTLTLTAANNFTNSVQLDEGTVLVGNAGALGTGNRAVVFNGGGVRVYLGGPTFANTNNVLTTGSIISSNGNYDAYNGPWTGSGTMLVHATGRLTPGNGVATTFANFTGTIDLSDSTTGNETRINLGSGSAPYNLSAVTLNTGTNGGRFSFRPTTSPVRVLIGALLGGPGTRLMSSEQAAGTSLFWEIGYLNTTTTFDGTIQNRNGDATRVGHLVKVGTGKLTLTGTNTYTGNTTVSNGTLALGATGLINSTNPITVVAPTATFDVSAFSPAWTNSIVRSIGGNGVITGSVALVAGTLSPGTSVGRLTFANDLFIDGTSGTTTNFFEIGTATNDSIQVTGNLAVNGTIVVRLVPTGPFILNGTYPLFKWGGALTGDTNNLVLEYPPQTGTLVLDTNLVTREILLKVTGVSSAANLVWKGDGAANVWDLSAPNWLNGVSPAAFINGDNVTFNNFGSNNVPVDITTTVGPGNLVVNSANSYIFKSSTSLGKISSGTSLFKTNSGKLTIVTDNDYAGTTTVAAGILQLGDGTGVGTLGAGTLTNNGTVIFNRGADLTFSSVITGSGSIIQNGGDVVTLSAANTYAGNTIISNGTVRANSTASLSTNTIVLAGGILNPQAQVNNPINLTADGTLSATLEIAINNTLSGSAGTLFLNNSAGNGFRFLQTTSFAFSRPIELQSGARTVAFYNIGSTQTYSGVISGPGGLHRRAPSAGFANDAVGGHVVLTAANTYSGGTTLSEGNIGLGSSSVVDVDNVTVLSGPLGTGPVTYGPPATAVAPFGFVALYAVGGPRTLANPITYAVQAAGDTTQEPLTFNGANDLTLSGTVTLSQTAFPCGFAVNNNTRISGVISDAGSLLKLGSGTLTLSGDNSYTGDTTVSAGKLLVQNTTGSGTGAGNVTVNSGATLGGTGAISGTVTVQAGATLAPGASIGTLTVNNDLTIAGNLLIEVNRSLSPAQSNDVTIVSGALSNTGAGTLTVSNLDAAPLVVGSRFVLFNKPVANGGGITITGGGATWVNNLAVDGSITVASLVSSQPPLITSTVITGSNINISGTNGTAGGSFSVLSSTNLTTPRASWAVETSGTFGAGGSFSVNIPVSTTTPAKFYLLKLP